jgi:hypothetical protein
VENVWPNKIEYSLVIPQKAIIFGTCIEMELKFTSLLKGLKIGKIRCELIETQEFTLFTGGFSEQRHKTTREVANWDFELTEDNYQDMMTESGQDGHVLNESLPLPKSLRKCLQDVETPGIKVRHKVKFNIQLHNPDGHTSEVSFFVPSFVIFLTIKQLRATLPVTIFISPNMAIDESGNLLDQTPDSTQSTDIHAYAPPLYGAHVLDQLYADIDLSGLRTPAPQSGMNTPFYNQSRSGSAEMVASMDGIANTAVLPDALENRLHNLNYDSRNSSFRRRNGGISGDHTPAIEESGVQAGYFDGVQDSRSNPLSRRTSEEDNTNNQGLMSGMQTPQHIDYSDLDLTKVPSYTTATKAPVRGMSSQDLRSLPDYQTAVSAPPSPELGASYLPSAAAAREHPASNSNGANNGHTTASSPGPRSTIPNLHLRGGFGHSDSDAPRRFHLLQARGRA